MFDFPPYELTRFVFLRVLGFVYLFAFLSLARQVIPLLGERGLTPAKRYLATAKQYYGRRAYWELPTVFWLHCGDRLLQTLAWIGVALSLVVLFGFANVPILLLLWLIYLSYVHIGQVWYGYGWEAQLLETSMIAVFMVPLLDPSPFPAFATPLPAILLLLWLTFRIHIGAGLIKLRGDPSWRKLTALYYHFETQPIPNPLSRYFHFLPKAVLKFGTLWNHIVELIVPLFIFIPGPISWAAGLLIISFQLILILSGNLSFLNWLTILPAIACLDDRFWQLVLPDTLVRQATAVTTSSAPWAAWAYFAAVTVLSIPVVRNLLSRRQIMNTSFNPLHLVNTYGAFGTVGRERYELVLQGTRDLSITPQAKWEEYEFPGKPTDIHRTPPVIAPYQPRVDWQIWFAAMQSPDENPWLIHLIWKLLHNDPLALELLKHNPFPHPPKFIRVAFYRYRFAKLGSGRVWDREYRREWLPPLSVEKLRLTAAMHGWD